MSDLDIFYSPHGIDLRNAAYNQQAMRIYNDQLAAKLGSLTGQGLRDYGYLLSQANFYRAPQKPLDERFADFKRRLDAAVAKRRRK